MRKDILAPLVIMLFSLSLSGCIWFEAADSSLTKQDLAIQNKDWRYCQKASLPDACLLGYARAVQDRSVCASIYDEQFKEMCDEIPCGRHNEACCFEELGDGCDSPSRCYEGTCHACGLIGMSSCMINDGEVCYEGSLTADNRCA